ncbi:MAG: hypothetical protein QM750_11755 [Rubrivivax sp.]
MGLLDILSNPDLRASAMLMAAGGPSREPASFGQRMSGLLGQIDAMQQGQQDRKMQQQLQQAQLGLLGVQIDDTKAQAQQRQAQAAQLQRRAAMVDAWMNPAGDLRAANADTLAQTGSLAPTVQNAQVQGQALQRRQQQNPLFGIPREAVGASLALEDGKSIPEWLFKRGTPNIDFISGVAVDKNRVAPGFSVPTISQDGKASQLVSDPWAPGGFRVVAPAGAAEVYGGYRRADEQAKADADLVKVFNPGTGREEYVSRSQALERARQQGQPAPMLPAAPPQAAGAIPPLWREQVQADLADPRTQFSSPAARQAAQRVAGVQQQPVNPWAWQGMNGVSLQPRPAQPGPMAAGPSTREAALAEYDRGVQKDFAERRKSIFDAAEVAGSRIGSLQQLGALLAQHDGGSLSPAGLQIAKAANSLGLKIDPQLGNKEAAAALSNQMALDLRNPAGGAGMPGALSNSDREFLASMVPGLATSAQGRAQMIQYMGLIEQRKQQVAQFARNYEAKHGRLDNGFFDQMSAWADANPLFDRRRGR